MGQRLSWPPADANGNNLHVVWHDDSDCDGFKVWYTKNTNLGSVAWPTSSGWTLISYPDPSAAAPLAKALFEARFGTRWR